jgi:hypothetical protein
LIVSSLATTTFAANLLYLGTYALALGGLAFGSRLLAPKPEIPKPEDGSYNLKQNVPPRTYVLGTVKKGGDYVFLEERSGVAHHVMVWSCHRIEGFVTHYAHDEPLVLDGSGNVTNKFTQTPGGQPTQYLVNIQTRKGLDAETAYGDISTAFPTIWGSDFRGDGLASVYMRCRTAIQEYFLQIFPNQMPQHSAIGNGALLYDPRKDSTLGGSGPHRYTNPNTWEFSRNLALMRLWHLCHPVGGKLSYSDMYLPDWINAANVCDQNVINRSGGTEKRYHGGLWFRSNNDPIEVGRNMDQAAELVVYERPDGLVGVHAGEFVAPDIRLTRDDIISLQLDGNTRDASTVLAVRGRFVDTTAHYNTVDAAIYGDPYVDETERTRTIDNVCVQSHNHVQRLQKIGFIRANAPRASIVAHYEAAKDVPYRRFVRVHVPPKMTEAIIELTSSPKISLRNMTVEFSGIVVPDTLYDFNAAVDEGAPGSSVIVLPPAGVPVPTGFTVSIKTEVVTGGATAAYAAAQWSFVDSSLSYEFEWEPTSGSEPARSVLSTAGKTEVRSNYLADGVQYRFRLRAWGGGVPSEWTSYQTLTSTADPTPPSVATGVGVTGGAGQANFTWTAPNSANYGGVRIYINTTNSMTGATLVATEYGPPNIADGRVVTGLTAGTKYGFVVAINKSGTEASPVATGAFSVT